MKIEKIQSSFYVEPVKSVNPKHLENKSSKEENLLDEAAIYEHSENKKPLTYTKSGHVYDHETVDKLKKQSEQAHAYLKGLVEKLLLKQGHSLKTISAEEWADVEIDEATRLEAQKMIDPGGPYSPEAVSDRLVDFAMAISGGDIEKLDKLKEAIEEGFRQAEEILGELPEISKETYKLTMEKLDAWANEGLEENK